MTLAGTRRRAICCAASAASIQAVISRRGNRHGRVSSRLPVCRTFASTTSAMRRSVPRSASWRSFVRNWSGPVARTMRTRSGGWPVCSSVLIEQRQTRGHSRLHWPVWDFVSRVVLRHYRTELGGAPAKTRGVCSRRRLRSVEHLPRTPFEQSLCPSEPLKSHCGGPRFPRGAGVVTTAAETNILCHCTHLSHFSVSRKQIIVADPLMATVPARAHDQIPKEAVPGDRSAGSHRLGY